MTSSHHAPYVQGYTRATLAGTEGCDTARWSESQKAGLGSDWRLKLASMKAELLVIPDQQRRGEYVPGSCTHRPSHHESGQHPKPVTQPFGTEPASRPSGLRGASRTSTKSGAGALRECRRVLLSFERPAGSPPVAPFPDL